MRRLDYSTDELAVAASQKNKERNYWLNKLAGEPVKCHFPYDYPQSRRETAAHPPASLPFTFPGQLCASLVKISNKSQQRLHMILAAALIALLYKYTGMTDIIVGAPVIKQETEARFLNTLLILRNQMHLHMSFKDLLLQFRQTMVEATEHQNYPLKTLLHLLDLPAADKEFPLLDIVVLLENLHDKQYILHIHPNIIFSFRQQGEDVVQGVVEYNSRLYCEDSLQRIINHYTILLEQVLADVQQPLYRTDILSALEKRRILQEFNQPEVDYPKQQTVHGMFKRQAHRTPNDYAVVYRQDRYTYGTLDQLSDRLARWIRKRGIAAGCVVPLLFDWSVELMAAVMGVLKAGAAYLPVDPNYPPQRIKYILNDSSASLVFTGATFLDRYRQIHQNLAVFETCLRESEKIEPEIESAAPVSPHDPAYVIYTSGSTGQPKGIVVEHHCFSDFIDWAVQEFQHRPGYQVLLSNSFASDGAIQQIFPPLVTGGTLHLLDPDVRLNIEAYLSYLQKHKINNIDEVPVLMNMIFEAINRDETVELLPDLTCLCLGSEYVPIEVVRNCRKYLNHNGRIINAYGPAETSVETTTYHFDGRSETEKSLIGKPRRNLQVYILDKTANLCPIGIPGEICIGGIGVARGYLNRPQLTAEKFIDYKKTKNRIYRTGDLGRWLEDGNIEFLGRIDHQVMLRGYRLELGEIENTILKYPYVNDTCVIKRDDNDAQPYLCAFIAAGEKFSKSELRAFLAEKLPHYMIPGYFILMEQLPLNPNGKIDRQMLSRMDIQRELEEEYLAPRNQVEETLAEIWQQVLGKEQIGINENFFMIGGDSIKTIQIVSRMNKAGYKFEMRDIFQNPSIARLAPLVKRVERVADQSLVTGVVPLTPIQKEFFRTFTIAPHHHNQAVMLYSKEGFGENNARKAFSKLQEHHDALRMTFETRDGEVFQVNHGLDYPLSLVVRDLENHPEAKTVLEQTANEIQQSIDLEKGPLMKLGLFHLDDGDRLLIVVHHLVMDGVSWRILFEDVGTLLQQTHNKQPPDLPPKSDSFKVWSEKLNAYANSPQFLEEKDYWEKQQTLEVPELPGDFTCKDSCLEDSERCAVTLEESQTQLLLTGVNRAFGTEINHILLTALGLGLKRCFHHQRYLVALEGHGREEISEDVDVSRTVGWFTAIYPILLEVSHEHDLARQIKEIKETYNRVPHHGIGYGILEYLTAPEHKQGTRLHKKPQINFNYLGQFDTDVQQQGSFEVAAESPGNTRSPSEKREYDLEISAIAAHKQLFLSVNYSKKQYRQETMQLLVDAIKQALHRIISYCTGQNKRQFTPSDFTYKELSIEKTDRLTRLYPDIEDLYPLTPMQEGMLFHALYDKTSPAYFEQVSYRLQGELNIPFVEKSLNELLKRYDILRTVFIYENQDQPLQVVLKERQVDFCFENICHLQSEEEKTAFIHRFKEKDRQRSFDLSRDVLMRVAVIRVNPSQYEFIWSHHHILMDGWCTGILISDYFAIYSSLLQGRTYTLPTVTPFKIHIQWLEKQDKAISTTYWTAYLEGFETVTAVPGGKSGQTPAMGYLKQQVPLRLESEPTRRLNQLAGRLQVTINTLVQVVWGILLAKYNRTRDAVFGAVVSGRISEIAGVESMVGLFINTIPVRIKYDPNTSFSHLLKKVQDIAIESEPHHYYPLAEIQARHNLKQDLLDHIMVFENYPVAEQIDGLTQPREPGDNEAGVSLELFNIETFEQTNYDFYLTIAPGERLSIRLSYNAHRYDPFVIQQIAGHLQLLFRQILENAEITIDELNLLSEEEKNRLLYDFNDTQSSHPLEKTITRLFSEQVNRQPHTIAVADGSRQLTYGKLNESANRLARRLRDKAVGPNRVVGLMTDRSIDMVTGILGILTAGGAYLPIDPDLPGNRRAFTLKHSNAELLLTNMMDNTPAPPALVGTEIITMDILHRQGASPRPPLGNRIPGALNKPADLAYVIFTSGSTGSPKGVMIEHRNVVNLVYGLKERVYRDYAGVLHVGLLAPYVFDASVKQLFGALLLGHRLVIAPGQARYDGKRLRDFYRRQAIDVSDGTPAHLFLLCEGLVTKSPDRELGLRHLLIGGEILPKELVRRFFNRFHRENITVTNVYGPTECCVDSAAFTVTAKTIEALETGSALPVGTPMPNQQIYIVDQNLNLQPPGIVGELCIGGANVGRGYIGNLELTTGKFPEDPFRPGQPMYHTGDLARWLENGNIQLLGRADQQVKIRGFRVELGEIEAQLLKHELIKETVVIDIEPAAVRETEPGPGDKQLCAYIVPASTDHIDMETAISTTLKEYLSDFLPGYMIPSYFVVLDKIPLTPNGKIHRSALPAPVIKTGEIYAAPGNEIEKKLAEIWTRVLFGDIPGASVPVSIGIDDNFFQLGGHSLKATVLVSQIHKVFDAVLPLQEVFAAPTIRAIARYIAQSHQGIHEDIKPLERKEYYPQSSAQKRLYVSGLLSDVGTSYNLPSVLKIHGEPDKERYREVIAMLIHRHETLRTSFDIVDNVPVQRIHEQVEFSLLEIQAPDTSVEVIIDDFVQPFDLSKAPLLRAAVVTLPAGETLLMYDLHHIIADGTSMGLLIAEFMNLYAGQHLRPLKLQYKDYAGWQHLLFSTGRIKEQEKYWLNRFSGPIPRLNLHTDYPRPEGISFAGDGYSFKLPARETSLLTEVGAEYESTLFMKLMAAFYVLLFKYTGQGDIIVGCGIMGRPHADLMDIIGMFVNMLPLRNYPRGEKTFNLFLQEVTDCCIHAFAHQDLQFETLVDRLNLKRDASRNPLFDVSLVVQNFEAPAPQHAEKTPPLEPLDYKHNVTHFDITVIAREMGDEILFNLVYATALFKPETIKKLSGRFLEVLKQVVENKNIKLKDIKISHDIEALKTKTIDDDVDFGF